MPAGLPLSSSFSWHLPGTWILQLFGITLEAFRIAGGILLFGIGMEMVYAKTSRTKLTATEKYESRDTDDIAIMPIALPMIAGPGAITTTIVLMNEATTMTPARDWSRLLFDRHLDCDHVLYDAEFRIYHEEDWTTGVPGDQPSHGYAAHCYRCPVRHQWDKAGISPVSGG